MERGFKFHEHTADITVECWASTLEKAFEEAALATLEVIVNTSTVDANVAIELDVEGIDLEELLVEWVGKLIALIDINYQFYSRFEVNSIITKPDGYLLSGKIWGEPINLGKHDTRTEVKAMTYADLQIEQKSDLTTLRFTLDL